MKHARYRQIFQNASVTYYFSSLFFPASVRNDVSVLYAFVRTADDYVDQIPQDGTGFASFRAYVESVMTVKEDERKRPTDLPHSTLVLIEDFVELANTYGFERTWIDAFLDAMASDLTWGTPIKYHSYADLKRYMYGSAEVIGLMMCKILDIDVRAHSTARKQGEAMQLINFIRDVAEDTSLGRVYIPTDKLDQKCHTLADAQTTLRANYRTIAPQLIELYFGVQQEATSGYQYLPLRYLIPIKTAAEMYQWTARQILADPDIVWRKKVKPSKIRVLTTGLKNTILGNFW